MVKKRDKLEIIKDILKTINERRKIGPTKLLQKSNLSPKMFKEYVGDLQKKDFIKKTSEKNKKHYLLTGKGIRFLEEYKTIENFVRSFGL